MTDRTAYQGLGADVQIRTNSVGPVFTSIYGFGDITGPAEARETIDTTTHDAYNTGGYRTFIGGLRDGGELSADINWVFDDPGQNALEDQFHLDVPAVFRVVQQQTDLNETAEFTAIITNLGEAHPVADKYTRAVTLKITGPITRTNDDD